MEETQENAKPRMSLMPSIKMLVRVVAVTESHFLDNPALLLIEYFPATWGKRDDSSTSSLRITDPYAILCASLPNMTVCSISWSFVCPVIMRWSTDHRLMITVYHSTSFVSGFSWWPSCVRTIIAWQRLCAEGERIRKVRILFPYFCSPPACAVRILAGVVWKARWSNVSLETVARGVPRETLSNDFRHGETSAKCRRFNKFGLWNEGY